MNRILLTSLIACVWLFLPASLFAQGPAPYVRPQTNPYAKPVFSPYLNLLRGGASPAVNYYGIVRPEIEFRSGIQSLQQQVTAQANTIAADEAATLPGTGHSTQFNNLSHYFYYQGAAGQGLRRASGPALTGSQPAGGGQPAIGAIGGTTGPKPARTR
jgi:hypothetical protein